VVGVVAHVLGHEVLEGVDHRHLEVTGVRLSEPHVVLGEHVAAGQPLGVCDAHVRRHHGAVVQVEGFDVHPGLGHV
jgi:hypothetical protein